MICAVGGSGGRRRAKSHPEKWFHLFSVGVGTTEMTGPEREKSAGHCGVGTTIQPSLREELAEEREEFEPPDPLLPPHPHSAMPEITIPFGAHS